MFVVLSAVRFTCFRETPPPGPPSNDKNKNERCPRHWSVKDTFWYVETEEKKLQTQTSIETCFHGKIKKAKSPDLSIVKKGPGTKNSKTLAGTFFFRLKFIFSGERISWISDNTFDSDTFLFRVESSPTPSELEDRGTWTDSTRDTFQFIYSLRRRIPPDCVCLRGADHSYHFETPTAGKQGGVIHVVLRVKGTVMQPTASQQPI